MEVLTPKCRASLNASDVAFILAALLPGSENPEALERLLADDSTRDDVLDHPLLFRALLENRGHIPISTQLYFYVVCRHVLREHGITDRDVADYVASLMAAYVRSEQLFDRPSNQSRRAAPFYVQEMVEAINRAAPYEKFLLTTSVANRSLFFSGLFPGHLNERTLRRGAPDLEYYDSVGAAHYRVASTHVLAQEFELVDVFEVLGHCFSEARHALNQFSSRYASWGHN
ncbi:MAG: hypothetical protein ACFBZ8_13840 [Opitutales bacterium]